MAFNLFCLGRENFCTPYFSWEGKIFTPLIIFRDIFTPLIIFWDIFTPLTFSHPLFFLERENFRTPYDFPGNFHTP